MVVITVVCCNPEKIRDKLCCKGRKVIKSIEIKKPEPPPPPPPPPPSPPPPSSPPSSPPSPPPPPPPPPPPSPRPRPVVCCGECYEGFPGGPCYHRPGRRVPPPPRPPRSYCTCGCGGPPKDVPPKKPKTSHCPPQTKPLPPRYPAAHPVGYCCSECYEGLPGGPCYRGQERPMPPPRPPRSYCTCGCGGSPKHVPHNKPEPPHCPSPPKPLLPYYPPAYPMGYCCSECYEGLPGGPCYHGPGRPVPPPPPPPQSYCTCGCGGYGYGRGCYVSRCDYYFEEENSQGCSIM